ARLTGKSPRGSCLPAGRSDQPLGRRTSPPGRAPGSWRGGRAGRASSGAPWREARSPTAAVRPTYALSSSAAARKERRIVQSLRGRPAGVPAARLCHAAAAPRRRFRGEVTRGQDPLCLEESPPFLPEGTLPDRAGPDLAPGENCPPDVASDRSPAVDSA